MLYFLRGIHRDVKGEGISPDSEEKCFGWAIIFCPDFSFDFENTMVDLEKDNYQSDLKDFKDLHDWNMPI